MSSTKRIIKPNPLLATFEALANEPRLVPVFTVDTCALSPTGNFRSNHWKVKHDRIARVVSVYTRPTEEGLEGEKIFALLKNISKGPLGGIPEKANNKEGHDNKPNHLRYFNHIGQATLVQTATVELFTHALPQPHGVYSHQSQTFRAEYESLTEYLDIFVLTSLAEVVQCIKARENCLPHDDALLLARIQGGPTENDSPLMPGKSIYVDGSYRYYSGSE